MIFVTGDTHGSLDIGKLTSRFFPEQRYLSKNDYVIILGDFGMVWNNSEEDLYWRRWLNERRFTTLFIDGNHENFDLLEQYETVEWHGGKVRYICDSIIHLQRGQVYQLEGKSLFAMGGGTSIDKRFRKPGKSWWPQEKPSQEEYDEAKRNLNKAGWSVDYVLTHTASNKLIEIMCYGKEDEELNQFFDMIEEKLNFKHWYFGHFHADEDITERHTTVYQKVIQI
jgi:predicted phosphodiesterase